MNHLVVIIGGGTIGLSIGWFLRKKGLRVTLLEEGECGRDASWASAGMLSPDVPVEAEAENAKPFHKQLLELQIKSHAMWPSFSKELLDVTGIDVELQSGGCLGIALNLEEEKTLDAKFERLTNFGLKIKYLDVREAFELEPNLNPSIRKATFKPDVGQVEPRKLVVALKEAFVKLGGDLREHTPVEKIIIKNSAVDSVVIPGGSLSIEDGLVLAAGAWSSVIDGVPQSIVPPIKPMKGQMLAVGMSPGLLNHIIIGEHGYYVPRKNNRLVVGATFEDVGYDSANTAGGVFELLQKACEVLPNISRMSLLETWTGLRPKSFDGAPVLGPTPIKGLIMATGHFHIGIILTPITAKLIADYIVNESLSQDIRPFMAERYTKFR